MRSRRTPPTGRARSPPSPPPATGPSATPTALRTTPMPERFRRVARSVGAVSGVALAVALLVGTPGGAQVPTVCTGDLGAAGVEAKPGSRLRFGITPAGEAGAAGPAVPVTPEDRTKTIAALRLLRAPQSPFVLRLNRFFWSASRWPTR